jgi:O-antigen ligase
VKNQAKAVEGLTLLLALGLPLVFNPWGASPFELPKAVLLRSTIILLGWVTVLAGLERPALVARLKPRSTMSWAVLFFGLAVLASTVFSPDPQTSVWGTLGRQQGLLTTSAYLGLYWLAAHQLRTRPQVRRLWTVLVWGSLPVVVYGLAQAAGFRSLGWETDAASPVLSTLGRANFLGSYLVLIIPLTAALAFVGPRRALTFLFLIAQLICLLFTLSRGAWLGSFTALIVALVARSYATGRPRPALAALALVLLAAGSFLLLSRLAPSNALIAQVPGFERLASLTHTDQGSVAARLTIWRATLPLIGARPWLGYGLDTMWPRFIRVFPPQMVYYQGRLTVDRAHNLWLDLGMSVGLIGALAFLALLLAAFRRVRTGLRTVHDRDKRLFWVALAASIGGYLADLHVSFALTATNAVFWLLLGTVDSLTRALETPERDRTSAPPPVAFVPRLIYLPPTLVLLALLGQVSLRPFLADVAFWRSQQSTRSLGVRTRAGERAVRLWPAESEYRLGLARLYSEGDECAAAEAQINAVKRRRPDDPQVSAAYGTLYAHCAALSRAETAWEEAIRLAPTISRYHMYLGLVLAESGELDRAVDALRRAVELDVTDGTAYQWLAEAYQALGKEAAAEEARRQAEYWVAKTAQ